jgi:hypothetical protein
MFLKGPWQNVKDFEQVELDVSPGKHDMVLRVQTKQEEVYEEIHRAQVACPGAVEVLVTRRIWSAQVDAMNGPWQTVSLF